MRGWLDAVRAQGRGGIAAPTAARDLLPLLDEMRLVKDDHELAIMRRAGQISAAAHRRAMAACHPGVREYELEAELLYTFRKFGAQAPAYTSIVAAGANACVLHYPAGNAIAQDGDLILIDAACELDGYASDITRTFPASGRFTPAQRELYDIVLAAQQAAVDATRAGASFDDPHQAARARAVARLARHRHRRPHQVRGGRRRDRRARLRAVLHAPHRPLARHGRARLRRLPRARRAARRSGRVAVAHAAGRR